MKKILSIFLGAALIFAFAACGDSAENSTANDSENDAEKVTMIDGYELADSPLLSDEVLDLFSAGDAAEFTPLALVGEAEDAENGYGVLCEKGDNDSEQYYIVYVKDDAEYDSIITRMLDCNAEFGTFTAESGSWEKSESPEIDHDAQAALANAEKTVEGVSFKPIAFLGSQVVSGMNFRLLCEVTYNDGSVEPFFAIVHVYEDLEGNASISEVFDFSENLK